MFRHILVPLDGSARAAQALSIAARLARASQGTITLFQAVNLAHEARPYGIEAPYLAPNCLEDMLAAARHSLEQQSHDECLVGIRVHIHVALGNPAEMILLQSAEPIDPPVDLIVISSHGHTGMKRWLLGSVAEKVARHALVPVLILRDDTPLRMHTHLDGGRHVRALVPLDASPRSQDALAPAAQLVTALSLVGQGELHLAQMVVPPERANAGEQQELLQAASRNLTTIGQSIREGLVTRFGPELHPAISWSVSLTDDIAEGIVRIAEDGEQNEGAGNVPASEVIALTTHGFGGIHRWQMGSIAERVLHATRLPILLVRPEDMVVQAHQRRETSAGTAGTTQS